MSGLPGPFDQRDPGDETDHERGRFVLLPLAEQVRGLVLAFDKGDSRREHIRQLADQVTALVAENERFQREFDLMREDRDLFTDNMVLEQRKVDALAAQVAALEAALLKCIVPYEGLLLDTESRKWIAPRVWQHIQDACQAARALLLRGG